MRLYLYALICVTAFALPIQAQEDPIQSTIQNQLDALQAEDFNRAFNYASPTIKSIFGSVENFETMVKRGYPMVWQHQSVRMLELRTVAGNLWQRVMITDLTGRTFLLDYMMVESEDGWQINAVQLLQNAGVGA